MGVILVNHGSDVTVIAIGGFKKTFKFFVANLLALHILACLLDGIIQLVELTENDWEKYMSHGELYLLERCNTMC